MAIKARGKIQFGFRRGNGGELVEAPAEQELSEKWSRRARSEALRSIAAALAAQGHRISHESVGTP